VQPIPTLDLRKYCRDSDKIETTVSVKWDWDRMHEFVWLKLGQVRLTQRESLDINRHVWTFDSYLGGHTDFEHDSAFVLRMELIGVQFKSLRYGRTVIEGFVNPNLDDQYDDFSVPTEGYDPFEGSEECEECQGQNEEREKHLVVQEGHYVPPSNPELYELIRGKRIEIQTGIVVSK